MRWRKYCFQGQILKIEMNEQSETSPEPEVTVNEPCIVVWDFEKSKKWYFVLCLVEQSDGSYTFEYLERCSEKSSKLWKHSTPKAFFS